MTLRIEVDAARARALAERLGGVRTERPYFMPRPSGTDAETRLPDLYLLWIGICQQTRTLDGVVDGVRYRGSDYLVHRLTASCTEDPSRFTGASLAAATGDDLRAWLSDDGDPASSTVDRVGERVRLMNDLGRRLVDGYGGAAANLLAASKGRLQGKMGLLERLSRFEAYRDPVRKKSFLLVGFLKGLGLLEPVDPEQLGLPVDYHILRVFLRAGVLRGAGARSVALFAGGEMSDEEDVELRQAAVDAGRIMTRSVDPETLDLMLWMIGRNCCFYDHDPVCRAGPCTLEASCSLGASTDLDCGLKCPFDGVCDGSHDAIAAARREPALDTDLY
ncbi:MAG: hypothetical protein CL908_19605 [Deltaproteobacteria bacterium]|jgi:hypothetical protein|nr:hypothetical protein [Deltaproteobacteria bacterium]